MKAEMYQNGINPHEARRKLFDLLTNTDKIMLRVGTDDEARFNRKSIEKMTSGVSIRNSMKNGFTAEQHCAVATDILNLYETSLRLLKHADKNGHPDVTIYRYGVPLLFNDAIAFITVKASEKHGKRVHDIELLEIGKLGGILAGERVNPPGQPAPSFLIDNIRLLESKVNTPAQKV